MDSADARAVSDAEHDSTDEADRGFKQENPSPDSREGSPDLKDGTAVRAPGHMQKRRRVTRACDECRRKKIKCDGRQPCTHCSVYSYDCTYDQPSNRRRNPAPQYVEGLEHRVHRAETLLHILIPNLDLNDPGIDAAVAQGWIPGAPGKGNPSAAAISSSAIHSAGPPHSSGVPVARADTNLESMVRAVGQLDMDEQGHWDYHGHSSGLSFMRRMREQLGDMLGPDSDLTPFVRTPAAAAVLDSPQTMNESPRGHHANSSHPASAELPPIGIAREMCGHAINDATPLMRVVHLPTFWDSFEKLYQTAPENYTTAQHEFLPLFHAAMALGHLFDKEEHSIQTTKGGYETAIQRGFAHFKTARTLMDIADCRDLSSIQAVAFMIQFLQSSAKLSQCYAYIGVALRSSLRMGLHRAVSGHFDPIEAETRKRVFWLVRKMDIYVGAMLGLPQTLNDDDIDQDFPLEVDDEYITKDGILPQPEGQVALMTAFNAHTRLVQLLHSICRRVYPIKVQCSQGSPDDKTYSIPFSDIRDIESDLERWKNDLPPILSPCPAPARYVRIQQLLRLSYAHAQVMLYRPFLHYVAMEKRSQQIDQRAYACAASYVNVSRNIIHITSHMKQKGLLNGAHWFVMYSAFFSILSLVYFAAENQDNPTTQAVMHDALEGRQVIQSLSKRSMAADRCTETLEIVFQRLPSWMRDGQQNPTIAKKRHYDDDSESLQQHRESQGTPVSAGKQSSAPGNGNPKRSGTYPQPSEQAGFGGAYVPSPWPKSSMGMYNGQRPVSSSGNEGSSTINSVPSNLRPGVAQYGTSASFANTAIPDLSTMMFPAADEPFTYPNQPLTTFENVRHAQENGVTTSRPSYHGSSGNGAGPSQARDDQLEAQYYALPPYFERPAPSSSNALPVSRPMSFPEVNYGQLGQMGMANSNVPPISNGGWVPSSSQAPAMGQDYGTGNYINIDAIFGGQEYQPMLMNPPYSQQ